MLFFFNKASKCKSFSPPFEITVMEHLSLACDWYIRNSELVKCVLLINMFQLNPLESRDVKTDDCPSFALFTVLICTCFLLRKKMRSVFSLCCSSSLHVCQWDLCLYSMCFSKQNDHFSPRPILQFPSLKKWWMRKFGSLNVLSRLIYFWNSLVNLQVFLCVLKFWCGS